MKMPIRRVFPLFLYKEVVADIFDDLGVDRIVPHQLLEDPVGSFLLTLDDQDAADELEDLAIILVLFCDQRHQRVDDNERLFPVGRILFGELVVRLGKVEPSIDPPRVGHGGLLEFDGGSLDVVALVFGDAGVEVARPVRLDIVLAELLLIGIELDGLFEMFIRERHLFRIGIGDASKEILEVKIPLIKMPVKAGRNVPILIEVAAMNERLKKLGYHSAQEFDNNILKWLESKNARNLYSNNNDIF